MKGGEILKFNVRSMFSKIFSRPDGAQDLTGASMPTMKTLKGFDDFFSPWDGNVYDDATIRTVIDTIARNAAMLGPRHIRRVNGQVVKTESTLDSLLGTSPNEYDNTYSFLYKVISQLYSYNNSFVYIKTDAAGNIVGLYPLNYETIILRELDGVMFCSFTFSSRQVTVPYSDIIHLRRHYNRHDIFGESNAAPLRDPVNILNSVKVALRNAAANCMRIVGILKIQSAAKSEKQTAALDKFTKSYTSAQKGTGYAVLDPTMEYKQLTGDIKTFDAEQMNFVRNDIYRYFGISEKIVTSSYTESEWNAFYESIIKPLALQMSQEFTRKCFTEREKGFGNEIQFVTNKLEYASTQAKVQMAQVLMQTGLLSVNEFREIFGFSAVADGEKRLVSLNFVDANKQNQYQGVNVKGEDTKNEPTE